MSYISYLLLNIPKYILSIRRSKNLLFLRTDKNYLIFLSIFLYKDWNSKCQSLIDFTCVDYPLNNNRFCLIYHLISYTYHFRAFLKFFFNEVERIPSLIYIYPNISWYERECWDFFGIFFHRNFNLRRLLLDYGFVGHPLRKDFPLSGFTELVYSVFFTNVVQKQVNLSQSYRRYESHRLWSKI